MQNLLLTILILLLFNLDGNTQLAVWNFTGETLNSTSSDSNITAGTATQSGLGGVTQFFACNGDAWSPSGWDQGDYVEFSITSTASFPISVTGFTFFARRSGTGPSTLTVRSSSDNYASELISATINNSCTQKGETFASPIELAAGTTLTFRIYGVGTSPNGNVRLDDVTILGSYAPVEFSSFSAKNVNNQVLLQWSTASELNNSHFSIETSKDGRNFHAIGKIDGNGTTMNNQNYRFTHEKPVNGMNYYRLKQVDYDGAFDYSSVESVRIDNGQSILVTPSAAISQIEVELVDFLDANTKISIIDMMGRTVIETHLNGYQSKMIDISDLSKGHYLVHVQAGSQTITKRFVKITE